MYDYPDVKVGETHSNLGTAYYLMKDYEKAYLYIINLMLDYYDEFSSLIIFIWQIVRID